ncbi:hypothetical protein [Stieleria bergensis]|uniref:hypothetical protein n=1 Tax=Stieleria bergensis TaxID=2528025 RepID=UPI003AF3BD53
MFAQAVFAQAVFAQAVFAQAVFSNAVWYHVRFADAMCFAFAATLDTRWLF